MLKFILEKGCSKFGMLKHHLEILLKQGLWFKVLMHQNSDAFLTNHIHCKYSLEGLMLKLKLQWFGYLMQRTDWLIGKDPDAGKDWRQQEKGMTEDEMVGWYDQLNEHEFEQAPGVGDGQGSLACCRPWGCKGSDMTEQLNWTEWTPGASSTAGLHTILWVTKL